MIRITLPAGCIATLAAVCFALYGGPALACMVCIPFPEKTATDRLLEASAVVLARENPGKPYSYASIETLKGKIDRPAISLFLDSATRRRLSVNPDDAVVLGLDGSNGQWTMISYATPAYQALVEDILERSTDWRQLGSSESRAAFFLSYLTAPDFRIHNLAYLEVGRASYGLIRRADTIVPATQIHRFISDPKYLEWHALYILLLGVDANAKDAETIRAAMRSNSRLNQSLNLSAWATALIESDGEKGIEWLETHYLGVPDRDADTILEIVKALSVQGNEPRSILRKRIAESYALLVENYPQLAGWAARDLTAWSDWRFADALAGLHDRRQVTDSSSEYAIDFYIARARSRVAHQSLQDSRYLP